MGVKGGLVTYINENFKVKELDHHYVDSMSWEGQFFEIYGNGLKSKLLLSNLYIPPRTSEDFSIFETNFSQIPASTKFSISQLSYSTNIIHKTFT